MTQLDPYVVQGKLDASFEEATCLGGGNMAFRETQWDIARGATKTFVVALEDGNDVSAARLIRMVVKSSFADSDDDILLSKDPDRSASDLENGRIAFRFSPTETAGLTPMTYWFDVWVYMTTEERYQVVIGQLVVRRVVWGGAE